MRMASSSRRGSIMIEPRQNLTSNPCPYRRRWRPKRQETWWIVDLLEELGHQPVLSNPKRTKAIAAARLKNDRVDAGRVAVLLRGDLLPTRMDSSCRDCR